MVPSARPDWNGRHGEVYRAHNTKLGGDVALKFLPPNVTADLATVCALQREARTLGFAQSPEYWCHYWLRGRGDLTHDT